MKRILILLSVIILTGNIHSQQTLTLEECRDLAIRNNKEVQITSTKIKAAKDERKYAFTNYFPKVSATGAYLWNQHDINLVDFDHLSGSISNAVTGSTQLGPAINNLIPGEVKDFFTLDIENIWIGSVSLIQPVFMGGKIITYNQIAKYAEELAKSMNDLTLQNVIYLTDQTYWQVVSLASKKELADAYVQLLQAMDRDVQAMIEAGVATEADGLSVKVKLNEAEVAQTKVENGLVLSRMFLAKVLGLPLESEIHLVDEHNLNIPVNTSPASADVTLAFQNRQELRSLDLATQIYRKKEYLELADMLPKVGLMASYMTTNPNSRNGFKNSFSGGFHVGVLVSVPLSDWWGGTYKRNAARAETHIKRLELEEARELIELEVTESVYKVNEAEKQWVASLKNMQNAEENLRRANLGFEEGVIPALNLMEAQTAWVSANSTLIDSQIEVKLTQVYLSKALGTLAQDIVE